MGREQSSEREEVLSLHKKLTQENEELVKQLQIYKDSDPEAYELMKREMQVSFFLHLHVITLNYLFFFTQFLFLFM